MRVGPALATVSRRLYSSPACIGKKKARYCAHYYEDRQREKGKREKGQERKKKSMLAPKQLSDFILLTNSFQPLQLCKTGQLADCKVSGVPSQKYIDKVF
jgi:hypothetical protein